MKKRAIAISVVLVSIATVAQAAPKEDTWYAGGKLGWSQFHDTSWYEVLHRNDGPTHKNQIGAGAFGGYQVNPYIGFEMGYDWLGRVPYKGSVQNGAFKAQGVQLTAKLYYPASNNLDVYTRLGGMVWHSDSKNSSFIETGTVGDTGISPVFAGGVEWAITPDIATRLEYQWTNNIGDSKTVGLRPDNSMLSLGVSYRFGQKQEEIPTTTSLTSPEEQTKHFTLRSDILFNFNKAILKPEGQLALDQLYTQLIENINPKDGSVIVLGFTDRIGSNTYNQNLSERRAKSVVDYLISKGIPDDKISSRGLGESRSVTNNTCDKIKNRSTLINCLAPDRRVEVEIRGMKDVSVQPAAY